MAPGRRLCLRALIRKSRDQIWFLNQKQKNLRARSDAKLLKDIGEVELDRLLFDEQSHANLFICFTLLKFSAHLNFTFRESVIVSFATTP